MNARTLGLRTTVLALCGAALMMACEDQSTHNPEPEMDRLTYWEQRSLEVAAQQGRFELACEQVSTETLGRNDAVMVKWYSIGVNGCGKRVIYQVTCAHQQCSAERKSDIAPADSTTPAPAETTPPAATAPPADTTAESPEPPVEEPPPAPD